MTDLIHMLTRGGIPLREGCPLSRYNTFRIGGTAALAVFPETREQLLRALQTVREAGVPYTVIGKGSNVLFPDGVYEGVIVFTGNDRRLTVNGNEITASAGVTLSALAAKARSLSLSGAEFAAGIPGTVGGAVFMNAGAFGGSMEQITVCSDYWDHRTGKAGTLYGAEQGFGTRSSVYMREPGYTVLSATLRLTPGDRTEMDRRMEEFRTRRRATQPLSLPNAGSVFRHPPGHYAGKLIEDCGLKGTVIGGAEVSVKHAGFIVNRGNATSRDVRELIAYIRERVLRETGIALECELRVIGNEA